MLDHNLCYCPSEKFIMHLYYQVAQLQAIMEGIAP